MPLKVGDIVFLNNENLLSKAVRLVQTGKFGTDSPSHCAIVSHIDCGKVFILEAHLFRGVREIPLNIYDDCNKWVKRTNISENDINKMLNWMRTQIGLKYDWTAIAGIFLRSFCRFLGPKVYDRVRFIRNFLDSKVRWFCSEIICIGFFLVSIKLWRHPCNETTPHDLNRSELLYDVES